MKLNLNCIFILPILLLALACKKEKATSTAPLGEPIIALETIVSNYEIIWGMDFLPNGDLIFGEKRGRLYLKKLNGNQIIEITGLPAINASGQGGLLDIKVDPAYTTNGWIYVTYTNSSPSYNLKFSKFKIVNDKVSDLQHIFTVAGPGGHNGSRILFDKKGFIYLCVGEGPSTGGGRSNTNKNSSDPASSWGKIHRFKIDGSIPNTNPIIKGNATFNSIFSVGHRNPQGLALNPSTGDVWESEHGPLGGDEINIISSNGHYGWPAVSVGKNYDGTIISQNHDSVGITKPIYTWTPSIGICGITFITGKKFKSWSGNLIVSGLASQKLYKCVVKDNKIIQEEIILTNSGRVRNVIQGPDESLYVSVEGPGRIIRIIPK